MGFTDWFRKKPKSSIQFEIGKPMRGPAGLGEALEAAFSGRPGGPQYKRTALLMTKDHPEVEQVFKNYSDFMRFLDKEAKSVADTATAKIEGLSIKRDEYSKMAWKTVEEYMRTHKIHPSPDGDVNLEEDSGVIYQLKEIQQ